MQYQLRALFTIGLLLLLAACGRDLQPLPAAGNVLPALNELAETNSTHVTSATDFELIGSAPAALSAGADASGTYLKFFNNPGGVVWAIYALQGFPNDGSVAPVSVTLRSESPCWLAVADFAANRWELVYSEGQDDVITPASSSLLSPSGAFYVAVVSQVTYDCVIQSLKVHVSSDVALPTPMLKLITATGKQTATVPSYFSAEGSDPGPGANIVSLTYDWNDGSPTEQTANPLTEVSHVWLNSGQQTITLIMQNDRGATVRKDFNIALQLPERLLLLVYNSDIPESIDLAAYYASSRNGRSIDPQYILGLPMGTNADADFDRATYNSLIRDPVKAHLDASTYKNTIKYILLVKGVPHRIADAGGPEDGSASVDSELCTLYSDLGPSSGGYPYDGYLINGPHGLNMVGDGFYLKGNTAFTANTFKVCYDPTWQQPNSGDEVPYTLNYLVGRLSAYNYDEAKLLVDRSINAHTSGDGWTILDSSNDVYMGMPMNKWDTMVDPVFPYANDSDKKSGYELLADAGYNVFADVTSAHIWHDFPALPAGATDNVLALCSWGTHDGEQPHYILDDLQFTYLPGACFMSYESYNAWNFDGDNLANRANQGQVCDFLRMGGTCAIGNAWEPYNLGIGDERIVFSRYIINGDPWIEAAYKGLRLMSWMEVVVGDPLCKVK